MSSVIELDDVGFAYRTGPAWARRTVPAVEEISFAIEPGQTLGLVGESGAGKSTLAKLTLGLVAPTSGVCRFEGGPMPSRRGRRGKFAAVLQHPMWSLNPRLTLFSSLAEPLAIAGVARRDTHRQRVAEMMEQVGLDPAMASRYPHELSGGQRQRASIARALVTEPSYVLFDEAVSALDVSVQAQILNLIKSLQSVHRFAALFISHDLAAVRYIADEAVVLRSGQIVDRLSARSLYETAEHPYTRHLQEASELLEVPADLTDRRAAARINR